MRLPALLLSGMIALEAVVQALRMPSASTMDPRSVVQLPRDLQQPSTASKQMFGPAELPSGFQSTNVDAGSMSFNFTMHLHSPNMAGLEAKMNTIALTHGDWLTEEQLKQYIEPSPADRTTVQKWLESNGISTFTVSPMGDRIKVQSTVGSVEKMFKTKLASYTVSGTSKVVQRARSYVIPAEIAAAVEMVSPLTSFGRLRSLTTSFRKLHQTASEVAADADYRPSGCSDGAVTPTCMRRFYGSEGFTAVPAANETDLMIMGLDDQAFDPNDLQKYLEAFRPEAAGYEPMQTFLGDGGSGPPAGWETMLDVELAAGLIFPLKFEFLLVSGLEGDEVLEGLQYVLDRTSPARPGVISISYGDEESRYTQEQADQFQKVVSQLSALGTTVLTSSGDNGINGVVPYEGLNCTSRANAHFPASPAILQVGATAGFTPEQATNGTDISAGGFWSGAGTSFLYTRPDYQQAVGDAYIASLPNSTVTYLNPNGRIYADVSAYGNNHAAVWNGTLYAASGTSASSPIFAAHLALVNSARRQKGMGRIGYVHPNLYGAPSGALKDITGGTTCGCPGAQSDVCLPSGPGFDPATGLGTPLLPGLLSLFNAV